jgi:hypothetical protein
MRRMHGTEKCPPLPAGSGEALFARRKMVEVAGVEPAFCHFLFSIIVFAYCCCVGSYNNIIPLDRPLDIGLHLQNYQPFINRLVDVPVECRRQSP